LSFDEVTFDDILNILDGRDAIDEMFDARPIEVNDLSVALFYFFDGHEIEVPMRPLNG
jgi:hypothetical protein